MRRSVRRSNIAASIAAVTIILAACGGGGGDGTPTQPAPQPAATITLAIAPATLSIAAGQSGAATLTITRSAGFTGGVTLALVAPPAGIAGTFDASPATGGSATLALAVGSAVAAGSYTLTVRGSATGVQDQAATLALTVVPGAAVGFTASVDPVEMELPAGRGWSAHGIVAIQRTNGFTGPVNVSISSLGLGAFAGASPATIAPTSSATNVLGLTLDGAAPGVYGGTVRVSGAGVTEQAIPFRIRVSLPSAGAITWRFCRADRVPRYFAVRDGLGAWRHIVPGGPAAATAATPATFSFDLTQATASVAIVWLGEKTSATPLIEGHHWNVLHMTRQEIIDQAAQECVTNRDVTTRQASGTVSGYQPFDALLGTVGRSGQLSPGSTGSASTTLSLRNLPAGPFDLLLTRANFVAGGPSPITVHSVILRRALDPAPGGTIPTLGFATDGIAPATGTITFANAGGERFFVVNSLLTTDGLNAAFSTVASYTQPARTWYGIPASAQGAGDLHQVVATTDQPSARRAVIHYARNVGNTTLAFGAPLSAPSVVPGAPSPWLLRATGSVAPEYVARTSIHYRESGADPRTMTIVATRGWLGAGAAYDIPIPDLSGAVGFTAFWNIRRGSTVRWTVTGGEGDPGGPNETNCLLIGLCPVRPVDGTTYRSAQSTGVTVIP